MSFLHNISFFLYSFCLDIFFPIFQVTNALLSWVYPTVKSTVSVITLLPLSSKPTLCTLLCDAELRLCKLHFCFVSGFYTRMWQEAALEGQGVFRGGRRELFLPVCFLWASYEIFFPPSRFLSIPLSHVSWSAFLYYGSNWFAIFSSLAELPSLFSPQRPQNLRNWSPKLRDTRPAHKCLLFGGLSFISAWLFL